jgi:hypothetical protein
MMSSEQDSESRRGNSRQRRLAQLSWDNGALTRGMDRLIKENQELRREIRELRRQLEEAKCEIPERTA